MTKEKKFYVAVKGLVIRSNKLLFLQRSPLARGEFGYWELPGGRLEFGEAPKQALLREINEETGLAADPIAILASWSYVRNDHIQTIGMTYLCTTSNATIILSEEHQDFAWIERHQISSKNLFPQLRSEIDEWDWDKIDRAILRSTHS
jgi:8-oxo-dGTP diphosphatase